MAIASRAVPIRWSEGQVLTSLLFAGLVLVDTAMASPPVVDQLREVHRRRQNVGYVFGGCDETTMDCSCFVQTAFEEAFGRKLPRSTLSQTRYFEGELLPRLDDIHRLMPETLCPGDLIYTFRGDHWETASRHVAIYYQNGTILHSARGVGVIIQPLDVLSHHRLHGVVRLFECRGPTVDSAGTRSTEPSRATRLPSRSGDDPADARSKKVVRHLVDDFFRAWFDNDRKTFASLWGEKALQWRKSRSGGESSELADWRRTFDDLVGRRWRYSLSELQIRGGTAYVEVDTEHPCPSGGLRGCGKTVQTFVWRLGPAGRWRIVQHEIGSAQ